MEKNRDKRKPEQVWLFDLEAAREILLRVERSILTENGLDHLPVMPDNRWDMPLKDYKSFYEVRHAIGHIDSARSLLK